MKNNAKKTNKMVKAIMCGATILGVIGVSGIFAYLTDTDTANNKFTIGEVKIQLDEGNWDESKAKNLTANAEIVKEPAVTNTGINSAYVFLKVTVPKANVTTVADDGTIKHNSEEEEDSIELFTYDVTSTNWVEIHEQEVEYPENNEFVERIYFYKKALNNGEKTDNLFDKVKFANVTEGQFDAGEELDVNIEAYAIQSENVKKPQGDEYTNDEAYELYNIYATQNS